MTDIETLRARLEGDPDDGDTTAELARALERAQQPAEAAQAYYRAAWLARRQGRDELFRERLQACLRSDPRHALLFAPDAASPQPEKETCSALVAHADEEVRRAIGALMSQAGHQVEEVEGVEAAVARLAESSPDVVITGPSFADGDATTLLHAAVRRRPDIARVLLTCAALGEMPPRSLARESLVDEHLDRPLEAGRLLQATSAAVWRQRHAPPPPTPMQIPSAGGTPPRAGRPDYVRAALLVAGGYALILSANALLLEHAVWSMERAELEASVSQRRATPDPTDPRVAASAQTLVDGLLLRATLLRPLGDEDQAAGAAADASTAGVLLRHTAAQLVRLELEVTSLAELDLQPEEIAASVRLHNEDGDLSPSLPAWVSDIRFGHPDPIDGSIGVQRTAIVATFPAETARQAVTVSFHVAGVPRLLRLAPAPALTTEPSESTR